MKNFTKPLQGLLFTLKTIALSILLLSSLGTRAQSVVDIITGSEVHTTLAVAVTEAGLVEALSAEGPFTVFAPTDDA
ncbi:MAG: fasciclin domain-containing protein, partial [Bacteroidales bacterium]